MFWRVRRRQESRGETCSREPKRVPLLLSKEPTRVSAERATLSHQAPPAMSREPALPVLLSDAARSQSEAPRCARAAKPEAIRQWRWSGNRRREDPSLQRKPFLPRKRQPRDTSFRPRPVGLCGTRTMGLQTLLTANWHGLRSTRTVLCLIHVGPVL